MHAPIIETEGIELRCHAGFEYGIPHAFGNAGPVVDDDHSPAVLGQGGREEDRTSARIARIAQQFDRDVFG